MKLDKHEERMKAAGKAYWQEYYRGGAVGDALDEAISAYLEAFPIDVEGVAKRVAEKADTCCYRGASWEAEIAAFTKEQINSIFNKQNEGK